MLNVKSVHWVFQDKEGNIENKFILVVSNEDNVVA